MGSFPMRIANTLLLFSVVTHTWVGLWTVATDYLTRMTFGGAATGVRLATQAIIGLLLLIYLLWGLLMIWGGA